MTRMPEAVEMDVVAGPGAEGARRNPDARADPEPDDRVVPENAHGPVAPAHADGVGRLGLVDSLEA